MTCAQGLLRLLWGGAEVGVLRDWLRLQKTKISAGKRTMYGHSNLSYHLEQGFYILAIPVVSLLDSSPQASRKTFSEKCIFTGKYQEVRRCDGLVFVHW